MGVPVLDLDDVPLTYMLEMSLKKTFGVKVSLKHVFSSPEPKAHR